MEDVVIQLRWTLALLLASDVEKEGEGEGEGEEENAGEMATKDAKERGRTCKCCSGRHGSQSLSYIRIRP